MLCSKIYESLKEIMPLELAMDWDNPGMLIGGKDKNVKKIYIALDATSSAIDEAIKFKADLMITHHPIIFGSIKNILDSDMLGKRIIKLIKSDITLICMHTNYDIAPGCMADITAELLGIDGEPLMKTAEIDSKGVGIGKVGNLKKPLSLKKLSKLVKDKLDVPFVTIYGEDICDSKIKRIAISPGSGKGMSAYAIAAGAQVLITGDITHHDGLDASEDGLTIIDASHYGTEHIFVNDMKKKLHSIDSKLEIKTERISYPISLG